MSRRHVHRTCASSPLSFRLGFTIFNVMHSIDTIQLTDYRISACRRPTHRLMYDVHVRSSNNPSVTEWQSAMDQVSKTTGWHWTGLQHGAWGPPVARRHSHGTAHMYLITNRRWLTVGPQARQATDRSTFISTSPLIHQTAAPVVLF